MNWDQGSLTPDAARDGDFTNEVMQFLHPTLVESGALY
jgi:hypothetical protein